MAIPLIEDEIIHDIFVNGIAKIERISGGLVRVTFYAEEHTETGQLVYKVVAKILRPVDTMADAIKHLSRVLTEETPLIAEEGKVRPN